MKRIVLIAIAAVLALVGLRLLLAGPEERVRRALDEMAELASKEGPEPAPVALGRARSLGALFAADVEAFDARTGRGVRGRAEVTRAIAWAREEVARGTVSFDVHALEVQDGRIDTELTVRILGEDGQATSPHDGARARLSWSNAEGPWRVAAVEILE